MFIGGDPLALSTSIFLQPFVLRSRLHIEPASDSIVSENRPSHQPHSRLFCGPQRPGFRELSGDAIRHMGENRVHRKRVSCTSREKSSPLSRFHKRTPTDIPRRSFCFWVSSSCLPWQRDLAGLKLYSNAAAIWAMACFSDRLSELITPRNPPVAWATSLA
jgi:hypothetical protein